METEAGRRQWYGRGRTREKQGRWTQQIVGWGGRKQERKKEGTGEAKVGGGSSRAREGGAKEDQRKRRTVLSTFISKHNIKINSWTE